MDNSTCTANRLFQFQVPSSLWSELAPIPGAALGKASQPRASAINVLIFGSHQTAETLVKLGTQPPILYVSESPQSPLQHEFVQ
jgi:hypothetical protein